jgi:hypothetical protein
LSERFLAGRLALFFHIPPTLESIAQPASVMSTESFDLLLTAGAAADVDDLADADRCAIIDWRSEPGEAVEAFQSFLPDGFLRYEFPDDEHITIHTGLRTTTFALESRLPAIPLANRLRHLLPPEHAAFLLRSSLDSDTSCYVVRPMRWWQAFRADYPGRFDLLFTEADHV